MGYFRFRIREALIRDPGLVLMILLSCLLSLVIFSCIAAGGSLSAGEVFPGTNYTLPHSTCTFDGNGSACGLATWCGVLGFLFSLWLVFSLVFAEEISSALDSTTPFRHVILRLAELQFSAFLAFLFFVTFVVLSDNWRTVNAATPTESWPPTIRNNSRTALAFSIFAFVTWSTVAWLQYKRCRGEDFGPSAITNPYEDIDAAVTTGGGRLGEGGGGAGAAGAAYASAYQHRDPYDDYYARAYNSSGGVSGGGGYGYGDREKAGTVSSQSSSSTREKGAWSHDL